MIDFEALVLGPAMAAFGQPVTVTPASGAAAYQARGVWRRRPVQVELEGGAGFHQTTEQVLGIKRGDFAVLPVQDDRIVLTPPDTGVSTTFEVFNREADGQGGFDLTLREVPA